MLKLQLRRLVSFGAVVLVLGAAAPVDGQVMVTRNPSIDNTLYEDVQGDLSNGAGPDLFAGLTNGSDFIRRAVLKFDLSTIPPGSTVTAATLQMRLNRAQTSSFSVALHKLNADWGEGTSNAGGGGSTGGSGGGAVATTNDATWQHRFYPSTFWTTDGGDFVAGASATTTVGTTIQNYTWSSATLRADVSSWINTPSTNFGWLVKGNETTNQSARRFDSSEATTAANRPLLSITYTPPNSPTGACCTTATGSCSELSEFDCELVAGRVYQGDATVCTPNPCAQPTGACCRIDLTCFVTTSADCDTQGGDYQGNSTDCSPNPCVPSTNVTLAAALDNTLYEDAQGDVSNGRGQRVFMGSISAFPTLNNVRRTLIAFDTTSIPSNATITNARLQLTIRLAPGGFPAPATFIALRMNNTWGEGTSDAAGDETAGAPAAVNDATWLHRRFNTQFWTTPGGDFARGQGTANSVGNTIGAVEEWTGPFLIADVQGWVRTPSTNFGWGIGGAETGNTLRGFDSRHATGLGTRVPRLIITYQIGPATGACCDVNGDCIIATQIACTAAGSTYQGDASDCSPNPCPQPTGACCLNSGLCSTLTQAACTTQSGTFQGDFSMCSAVECPIILTPFVDALPIPPDAVPTTGVAGFAAHYDIDIVEFAHRYHASLPIGIAWGYEGMYPGPTIEAHRDQTVTVNWINNLRDLTTNQLRTQHYLTVDECPHGPDQTGTVPVTVVHLHGAKVMPESDGDPDDTFGPGTMSTLYTYPNPQHAATMWYHDHALGITRLNVYMGLAGFYFIRDAVEDALNIPRGEFEVPLVIQDRSFNPDGTLRFNELWKDQFFGDFIVVNGKVWPFMSVKKGKYRFRMVNGSNMRVYTLSVMNGVTPVTFQQVATDLGLLPSPIAMTEITIAPGERADIVIDFAPFATGQELIFTNSAPAPFPSGAPESAIRNVLKFVVNATPGDTDPLPAALATVTPINPASAIVTRQLQLRRSSMITCPMHTTGPWLINDLLWHDLTETPRIGTTEIWEWVNRSGDTHPMHIHLVAAQVLNRQDFTMNGNIVVPTGPLIAPPASDTGWKDTVKATPNQITRVIARFEGFSGIFPYHCHILDHEDHEMMRQFNVLCDPPFITMQPSPATVHVCRGGTVNLIAAATGDVLQYQWRRDGNPLSNGPTPGGTIAGALTPALTITNIRGADRFIDCRITNPCGQATTIAVFVDICIGDFNCTGTISVQDIFDFLAAYFANNLSADVNNSGTISVQDIFDFLAAYFAGCA